MSFSDEIFPMNVLPIHGVYSHFHPISDKAWPQLLQWSNFIRNSKESDIVIGYGHKVPHSDSVNLSAFNTNELLDDLGNVGAGFVVMVIAGDDYVTLYPYRITKEGIGVLKLLYDTGKYREILDAVKNLDEFIHAVDLITL